MKFSDLKPVEGDSGLFNTPTGHQIRLHSPVDDTPLTAPPKSLTQEQAAAANAPAVPPIAPPPPPPPAAASTDVDEFGAARWRVENNAYGKDAPAMPAAPSPADVTKLRAEETRLEQIDPFAAARHRLANPTLYGASK